MKKITSHIYLGNQIDAYNILKGITTPKCIQAVVDLTADSPSNKWRTDKNINLKRVGLRNNLTKPQIKKTNTFIAEQHKLGRPVLICSKNEEMAVAVVLAFLVGHKEMTVVEATTKLEVAGIAPNVPETVLETIRGLEVKEVEV